MRVDARRVVLVGTALWVLAGAVLLVAHSWLDRHGHLAWLWTCAVGAALGLLGLLVMGKHRGEGRL